MNKFALMLTACSLFSLPAFAEGPVADTGIARAMALADNHQYDQAIGVLRETERRVPDDIDVKLAIARIYGWQSKYDKADAELAPLQAAHPDNPDIELVAAYNEFYRGHNDAAAAGFQDILRRYPNYTDATEGLKQVEAAQQETRGFTWLLDAGYEHSSFARQPQPNWSNEYFQVTHLFDQGATALHARYEHYDQFLTTDSYYELGVDHRFTPYLNGYLYAGHTVDPSFRPTWRTSLGGSVRLDPPAEDRPVVWLTLDMREDDYNEASFANVDPGVRIEYADWSLSNNLVMVRQWGAEPVFGWNSRIDTPAWNSFHFYAGYSDAPDTENAVTVYTASLYGGIAYDFSDAYTMRLAYTHDDRQNSYIRHVVDASVTYRF